MGFYQIKCINCGMVLQKTADVVYRMAEEELDDNVANLFRVDDDNDDMEEDEVISGMEDETQGPKCRYASCGKLIRYIQQYKAKGIDIGSVEAITEDIVNINMVPSKLVAERRIQNGSLQTGIKLTNFKINGKTLNGKITKRCCPYCHYRLPMHSGRMPTYTIGIFGHSSVGKTVYFTMLHGLMENAIPAVGGKIWSKLDTSHLKKDDAEIKIFWQSFCETRVLPSTTQDNALQEPYCRVISYRMDEQSEYASQCLLVVRDVVGEALTSDSKDQRRRMAVEFGCNADGLMIMVDPMTLMLPRHRMALDQRGNQQEGAGALDRFRQTLGSMKDELIQLRQGQNDHRPCTVLLTKEDILACNYGQLDINKTEPSIADGLRFDTFLNNDWSSNFLLPVHNSTKKTLKDLDSGEGMAEFLLEEFSQAVYIPVSAVGSKARVVTQPDGTSKVDGFVFPRFIEVPILYFLMQFHIIPPADQADFYQNYGKSMREWADQYAQNPKAVPAFESTPEKKKGFLKNPFNWRKE